MSSAKPSYWGPGYNGVLGRFKIMGRLAVNPMNYLFFCGMISSCMLLSSVPFNEKDMKMSKFINKPEIMEEYKKQHGHYPH